MPGADASRMPFPVTSALLHHLSFLPLIFPREETYFFKWKRSEVWFEFPEEWECIFAIFMSELLALCCLLRGKSKWPRKLRIQELWATPLNLVGPSGQPMDNLHEQEVIRTTATQNIYFFALVHGTVQLLICSNYDGCIWLNTYTLAAFALLCFDCPYRMK